MIRTQVKSSYITMSSDEEEHSELQPLDSKGQTARTSVSANTANGRLKPQQELRAKSRSLEGIHLTENPSDNFVEKSHRVPTDFGTNTLQVSLPRHDVKSVSAGSSPKTLRANGGGVERSTTGSPFKRRIRRANSMGATLFTAIQDAGGKGKVKIANGDGKTVMNDEYALQMTVLESDDEECKYADKGSHFVEGIDFKAVKQRHQCYLELENALKQNHWY